MPKLMSILQGSERQVADVAIERPADPNFKPTAAQGAKLRQAAGGGGAHAVRPVRAAFPLKSRPDTAQNGRIHAIWPLTTFPLGLDFRGHFSPYSPGNTS